VGELQHYNAPNNQRHPEEAHQSSWIAIESSSFSSLENRRKIEDEDDDENEREWQD
jgi:hypothetical protein